MAGLLQSPPRVVNPGAKERRRDPLPHIIVDAISALAVTVDGYKRGRPTMEGKAEAQEKIEEIVRELVSRG